MGSSRWIRVAASLAACAAIGVIAACAGPPGPSLAGPARRGASGADDDPFTDEIPEDDPPLASNVNDDGGAFGASSRPAAQADPDAGPDVATDLDAGNATDAGPSDAGAVVPEQPCAEPAGPGDLVVTELLIAARAGGNDAGEWIEVTNTRDCRLSLQGITIRSPRGAGTNTVTIGDAVEISARGTFVVAASAAPAQNHGLAGLVFAWNAADVLKNGGDTLTITRGDLVIDTTTYPNLSNLEVGRSLAFPADCPWSVRSDWARWSLTFHAWSQANPALKGTPNAANVDVACY